MTRQHYRLGRRCECGSDVSDRSKSGLCRSCFMDRLNSDPERIAKISAACRKRLEDPEIYAQHCERNRRAAKTRAANPELRTRMAKFMREQVQPRAIESGAHMRGRDYDAMRSKAIEQRWSWCPKEYRQFYRDLRRTLRRDEARRMVFAQIHHDRQRAAKARPLLSPFEKQDRALRRNPNALVANDARPSLSNPANYGEERWKVGTAA